MGAYNPPVLIANRLFNSSLVALANDDTSVTDYDKANEFVIVFQIDEEKGPWNTTYSLRWRNVTDAGSFAVITASGEMAWGTGTDLVNGDPITSKMCQASGGPSSTWQNGEQVEGAAVSDAINLADEYYTEVAWAVNPSGAHAGDQYEFEIYDDGNSSPIDTGVAKITIASGGITVPVGIPSGAGAPLAVVPSGAALIAAGIPSGVGAPLAVAPSGAALIAAGIPSGLGEALSVVSSGAAIVVMGLPSGVGAPLATSQLFDYVFSVGIPSGLGEPLSVTVLAGGSELVVVGIPSGAGAPLSVTATGAALVAAGIPSGLAEALSVALSLGANVTVGIPAGLGEALPTEQLYDYVLSVGVPGGVGTPLAVTVSLDGAVEESFIIIPARRRRRM